MYAMRQRLVRHGIMAQGAVSVLVFCAYFLSAKLGQYLFIPLHSAPAVFWLPAGIALAAVFLFGYRMALLVALAQLAAIVTSGDASPAIIVAATLGSAFQPLVGAYLLKRFGFTGEMGTAYDVFLLVSCALTVGFISPGIAALAIVVFHPDAALLWSDVGRMWAAGASSILTLMPLITSWRGSDPWMRSRRLFEPAAVFLALSIGLSMTFWTKLSQPWGLPLVCAVWVMLFWIAIRFTPRFMSAAIALAVAIAVSGAIIAHPTSPLDSQLFGDELIFLLFAPIFLVFSGVVHERRKATGELADRVRQLANLTERLSADDELKNEFIAVLAHELRNPLAPIVSTFELLGIRHEDDPESMELITDAQRQAASMRRLLDDLLDVARISRGKLALLKEPLDLREVAAHSAKSVEPMVRERKHELVVALPEEPLPVSADSVRLEQILVNLLSNAAKYTDPGGKIEFTLVREGAHAVARVRDNGQGIAAEDMSEIFLPFRQAERAPHQRSGGLGLGLSLAKQLVEMHDGSIEAESAGVGQGSVFTLRIPLAVHEQQAARPVAASDVLRPSSPARNEEPL